MDQDLHARIRRLERRSHLLAGTLVLGMAVVLAGFARQDRPETLRCERLDVVDAQGAVRATLGTDADGSTGLFLRDAAGSLRASLTHDARQTALFVYDGEEVVRLGAAHFAHGGTGFALHGPRSEGGAALYHKSAASLIFFEPDGTRTLTLPVPEPPADPPPAPERADTPAADDDPDGR